MTHGNIIIESSKLHDLVTQFVEDNKIKNWEDCRWNYSELDMEMLCKKLFDVVGYYKEI